MKNTGFTLIETLVAISILMIAIAGPLTVANKGYTASIDARNQSKAFYLAQEGIEYLNYLKDNHIWGDWTPGKIFVDVKDDTLIPDACVMGTLTPVCTLDSILPTPLPNNFVGQYYITLHSNTDQLTVTVVVYYLTGNLTSNITLEQVFSNYER